MTAEREERLLARVEDAFGVISVYEVDDYRFLEFGDAIEQSCVFTADPSCWSTTTLAPCWWGRCAMNGRRARCFSAWVRAR